MKRVFKTRYFTRWMRKTELNDNALCDAVREMAGGLIDADLGGGVLKSALLCRAEAKAAEPAPCWRPTKTTAGFLYSVSRRTFALM